MKTNDQPSLRSLHLLPHHLQDHVFSMLHRGQPTTEILQSLENAGFPGYSRQDLEFYARWGSKSFDFLKAQEQAVPPEPAEPDATNVNPPPAPAPQPDTLPCPTLTTRAEPQPSSEPPNANSLPAIAPKRRGKIARLSKDLRAQLNAMLEDGASYEDIIHWLTEQGHPGVNHVNLHNWKVGGYQDWRRESERLDNQAIQREWLAEQAADAQPGDLFPILDQLLASQMLDSLFGLDTVTLKQGLAAKPRDYIALANALSRLKRDAMNVPAFQQFLQKERKCAARKPVISKANLEYLCQQLTGEQPGLAQPSPAEVGRTVPGEPPALSAANNDPVKVI